nr:integrase, catalytic region, zinc finger, CCHC-type, peptidase aspartic, catalytic [Tanacetum cinerariifolium]
MYHDLKQRHDAIWVVVDRLTKSVHFLPIRKDYSVSRLAEIFQQEIIGERVIEGPEIIEVTNAKVDVAKEKLKEARTRQKSYADKHRRALEFQPAPSEPSKTNKLVEAEESIQDDVVDAEELKQDDVIPEKDKFEWFKQDVVKKPKTPDPSGSENRPLMLNKDNYFPWPSHLLRYANSKPNKKLIYNSIINGSYVRRMNPEPPDDPYREVLVAETFHEQTHDELTNKETSREDKFVPKKHGNASVRTKRITLSQPYVITKKDVNSDSNGLYSIRVDNIARNRRLQPRSNTKNDRSKDKAPEDIKTFLKKITFLLQAPVIIAEAISTTCYTQNCSIFYCRFDKTPYELINGRKLDIFFLHVFGDLCYLKNDHEDIGKLDAKEDIGFFIGYSATSSAPRLAPTTSTPQVPQTLTTSTTIADTTPTPINSSSQATDIPNTLRDFDELQQQQHVQQQDAHVQLQPKAIAKNVQNAMFDGNTFVKPFVPPSTSSSESSSQYVDP